MSLTPMCMCEKYDCNYYCYLQSGRKRKEKDSSDEDDEETGCEKNGYVNKNRPG